MILFQINFNFPTDQMGDTLTEKARSLAESINNEPGFISKIWVENPTTAEIGGIYLFKDLESATKYADKHVKRVETLGAKNIEYKYFTVNETLSKINKAL